MNSEKWVEAYFEKIEKKIKFLEEASFVEQVNYIQYKGVSDEEIEAYEKEMGPLSPVMKAFYRKSNGLHISWQSKLVPKTIETYGRIVDQASHKVIVPYDEHFTCEGWMTILPLEAMQEPWNFNIMNEPMSSSLGMELKEDDMQLIMLDYYNYYYDTCYINDGKGSGVIAFGEDYSACYKKYETLDFQIYMERLARGYFMYSSRTRKSDEDFVLNHEVINKFEKIFFEVDIDEHFEGMSPNVVESIGQSLSYDLQEWLDDYI